MLGVAGAGGSWSRHAGHCTVLFAARAGWGQGGRGGCQPRARGGGVFNAATDPQGGPQRGAGTPRHSSVVVWSVQAARGGQRVCSSAVAAGLRWGSRAWACAARSAGRRAGGAWAREGQAAVWRHHTGARGWRWGMNDTGGSSHTVRGAGRAGRQGGKQQGRRGRECNTVGACGRWLLGSRLGGSYRARQPVWWYNAGAGAGAAVQPGACSRLAGRRTRCSAAAGWAPSVGCAGRGAAAPPWRGARTAASPANEAQNVAPHGALAACVCRGQVEGGPAVSEARPRTPVT